MKIPTFALLIVSSAVLSAIAGCDAKKSGTAPPSVPSQAQTAAQSPSKEEMCQHFLSEAPYDKQRAAFLEERIQEFCPQGTKPYWKAENQKEPVNTQSRMDDPYWDSVYVDQVRAREDLRNNQSHMIEGVNFEIYPRTSYSSFVVQRKNGNREAFVSVVGEFPLTWIVDCENKRTKYKEEEAWEDVKPHTKGGNVLVHICTLPARHVDW